MAGNFEYTIDPDFDYTLDERGNTYIALRKIDWGNKGNFRLDIRKYYATEEGERMTKNGVSLITKDGANELTKVLVENGYGDDKELANSIIEKRPYVLGRIWDAFNKSPEMIEMLQTTDCLPHDEEDEYYDPEELI